MSEGTLQKRVVVISGECGEAEQASPTSGPELPSADNTTVEEKSGETKKKKESTSPLEQFVLAFLFGGQIGVYVLQAIVVGVLYSVFDEADAAKWETFGFDPASLPGTIITSGQFLIRLYVTVSCVALSCLLGLLPPLIGLGCSVGYFSLLCEQDQSVWQYIRANRTGAACFVVGAFLGWQAELLLVRYWNTYPVQESVFLFLFIAIGAFGLVRQAEEQMNLAREAARSRWSRMAEGEVGSRIKVNDEGATLADVSRAVREVRRMAGWEKDVVLPPLYHVYSTAAHAVSGVAYGFLLYLTLMLCFLEFIVTPVGDILQQGDQFWLWVYLWHGMKALLASRMD